MLLADRMDRLVKELQWLKNAIGGLGIVILLGWSEFSLILTERDQKVRFLVLEYLS